MRGSWKLLVTITVLYFVLVSGSFYNLMPGQLHDDGLQFKLAKSLVSGEWLGPYDALTLSKGITFPVWTAVLHILDIPLWFGNAVLYSIACFSLIFALRHVFSNKLLLVAGYTLLLFNPIVAPRVYRDTIAAALLLLVITWVIGMFFAITYTKEKKQNKLPGNKNEILLYSALGVMSLPAWWYLREDSFWILPFIASGYTAILVYIFYQSSSFRIWAKSAVLVTAIFSVPFLMVGIVGASIAWQNDRHYGRFVINDFTSNDFKAAYGALTRIEDTGKDRQVPVSYDMRQKAYGVSPSFKELKDCLDNEGRGYCEPFKTYGNPTVHDYKGGWFFWALRTAAERRGHYNNAATEETFYTKVAAEINEACSNQKIKCAHGERASLSPPFSTELIGPTFNRTIVGSKYLITLKDANVVRKDFPVVAYNPALEGMSDFLDARYDKAELNIGNRAKNKIRLYIARTYQIINPILTLTALATIIFLTVRLGRYLQYWREILLAWGLLLLILTRTVMLAYVDVTSFFAINYFYYQSTYPLMFAFEFLAIALLIRILTVSRSGKKPKLKVS